ncbi:MAG: YeeE/YedE thiosulfate transporter family protein [Halodesulfurarchaeum sp.]|nr:YeeE/YedE thiosulfate transporter family protein [Halodesulfurarchaeum sp.]
MALVPPELLASLFPNGVLHYAVGGVLIGLGVSFIYALTGLTPGASTVLESSLSYVSRRPSLNRFPLKRSRGWRLVFTAGIVSGAVLFTVVSGGGIWTTEVQLWRLGVGGFLVGLGTRLGKGCTSGHGICGVGSLSETSITNVIVFLLVAIGTALGVMALGVTP